MVRKVLLVAVAMALSGFAAPLMASDAPGTLPVAAESTRAEAPSPLVGDVPALWLDAARSGGTVRLATPEGPLTLGFDPVDLFAPGYRAREGGREVTVTATPWHLTALEDALVVGRVTLDDGFLQGVLVTPLGSYELDYDGGALAVVPTALQERPEAGATFDGPDTPEGGVRVAAPDATALGFCQGFFIGELGPSGHLATPVGLAAGWPAKTERIVLDGDKSFFDAGTGTWAARQLALLNAANLVYQSQFGLTLQVAQQHVHTTSAPISGADSGTLLNQLRTFWIADPVDRDVVFLFLDKNLESIGAGASVIGRAWCIGGAGSTSTGYALMTVRGLGSFFQRVTLEHELGHLYAAHHHYANCGEALVGCTVMINAVNLVLFERFSSLSRLHIRGWADAHT